MTFFKLAFLQFAISLKDLLLLESFKILLNLAFFTNRKYFFIR